MFDVIHRARSFDDTSSGDAVVACDDGARNEAAVRQSLP